MKNPGRPKEIETKTAGAAKSRNLKAALSFILDVIKFCHTANGIQLGKIVLLIEFNKYLSKCTTKVK